MHAFDAFGPAVCFSGSLNVCLLSVVSEAEQQHSETAPDASAWAVRVH